MTTPFLQTIQKSYTFKGESALLGVGMLDGQVVDGASINLPLSTMNRHGLIAGATGTGKSKTLQRITEILSDASVPCLLVDIKGDLSGLAAEGTTNPKIEERAKLINFSWKPASYPVEFLSLSQEKGVRLRATVAEFGPVLLSKILELNDTQQGMMSVMFQCCDENAWDLLDLEDLKTVLNYISNDGKADFEKLYGKVSTTTTGTILRKVIELEQQGAEGFFGELSFDINDLMRISNDGRGMISILRVTDIQDKPKLFSTFMLQMLAELYAKLPEEGDLDKPKLAIFIEEAHLVFRESPKILIDQIETIVKLIRSKGVGIYFVTQNPMDIPAAILAQLGLKVQHALRAFTAGDRKSIEQAAENFPETPFYKVDKLLNELGTGEALVTVLSEKGIPTALAHTMIAPPQSRMGILSADEIDRVVQRSHIASRYEKVVDRDSAREILGRKIEKIQNTAAEEEKEEASAKRAKEVTSTLENVLDSPLTRQIARTATSVIARTLLGAIFGKKR